mmetsp:Transcript_6477/g.11327  ORF Transcript_6477/g.11327 Transcript_6477/m.11327 type:complete len:257 (-) Transcript_6477:1652-2422(-)
MDCRKSEKVLLVVEVDAGKKGKLEMRLREGQDPSRAVQEFCQEHGLGEKSMSVLQKTVQNRLNAASEGLLGQGSRSISGSSSVFKKLYYGGRVDANILQQKLVKTKHRRLRKLDLELTFTPKINHTQHSLASTRSVFSLSSRSPSIDTERLRNRLLRREKRQCTFMPETNESKGLARSLSKGRMSVQSNYERLHQEAKLREIKLEKERSIWQSTSCSFRPSINKPSTSSSQIRTRDPFYMNRHSLECLRYGMRNPK